MSCPSTHSFGQHIDIDTAIRSAVQINNEGYQEAQATNLYTSPVVALHFSYDCEKLTGQEDSALYYPAAPLIQPNSSHRVSVIENGSPCKNGGVDAAVFADGAVAGSDAGIAGIKRRRAIAKKELEALLREIDSKNISAWDISRSIATRAAPIIKGTTYYSGQEGGNIALEIEKNNVQADLNAELVDRLNKLQSSIAANPAQSTEGRMAFVHMLLSWEKVLSATTYPGDAERHHELEALRNAEHANQ